MTDILIYVHAALGGLSLLAGMIAIMAKKGGSLHKRTGKVFFYALATSALLAILVTFIPGHESPFLLAVGVFSLYLICSGYRALRFSKHSADNIDRGLSAVMVVTGLCMIGLPLIVHGSINVVLSVFGLIGIFLSIQDFRFYTNAEKLRKGWMRLHLGKMTGGFIASVTAFVVVNNLLPGIIGWLAPTVVGSMYIAYWLRKLAKQTA